MEKLPNASIIAIPPEDADMLLKAAERQPVRDDLAYYDPEVLLSLYRGVRNEHPATFDKVIAAIRAGVSEAPYCVIVRGLKFDEEKRLYLSIARGLGDFVVPPHKEPRTRFVHQISPTTDMLAKGLVQAELLHTDGADHPEPPGFITMLCHRPDPMGGGRSRLITHEAVRQEIAESMGYPALLQTEAEAVPWQMAEHLGSGVHWRPILPDQQVRWRRYTIDAAGKQLESPLSEGTVKHLDALGDAIENSPRIIEFLLEQGDFMVADNLRTLHGRTALSNHPRAGERLMFRNWIRSFEQPV